MPSKNPMSGVDSVVNSMGQELLGPNGALPLSFGSSWYVSPTGDNSLDGQSAQTPKATWQAAINAASAGDIIYGAPGQYDEPAVPTVPFGKNLTLVGLGPRGSVYIEPSNEDQGGMVVNANDCALYNVGVAGEDTTSAVALTVTGARFRAYASKFEGGATQVLIGPGTDANVTAALTGNGADALFDDCEIAWGTKGIVLTGTDYGGCTQTYIRNCRFHDLTAESIGELVGSGGSAAVTFFGLNVQGCVFEPSEDGSIPTKYISLNADNANSGIVTGCQFPVALNSGKNLVSTAVIWTGNFHPAGLSTTQPS